MRIKEFSAKQAEILKFIYSDVNNIICDGAVRSGKTIVMTLAFVMWAMENFNQTNFAICGKTVSNAERNIVKPFQQVEGLPYKLSYKVSTRCLTVKLGKRENYFYLFGGKDESSYSLIQGITLAGVLFDEVALMPQSFVDQAIARTLSFRNAKLWFNCNPENPEHWFYKEWICSEEKEKLHLHFLMTDNPILGREEIERAYTMWQGVFYRRYILGEWVRAEGLVYSVFADEQEKYITDSPDYDFINIGVDFGGNGSFHSFTATGIKNDYSKITVLKSQRVDPKNSTPEDLYKWFGEFAESVKSQYGYINFVFCDSAEQVLIQGLRARFPELKIKNARKDEIINRIRCTTALMASGRLYMTKDCESLQKALCSAVYDEKSQNDTRLDNGTSDIDSLDSFEYSFEIYIPKLIKWGN